MSNLGVHTYYSDQQNMQIIREHYTQDPTHTKAQVAFLILCWKGAARERARQYYQEMKTWQHQQ
jgi:hypothetical protein